MTVQISTSDCDFIKSNRALYISAQNEKFYRGFPKDILVHSSDTGRVVHFTPVREGHPHFDHDFWDGEMAIYEPAVSLPNVDILVISYGM